MITYSYICPICGAYLDPGETCDCVRERHEHELKAKRKAEEFSRIITIEEDGQMKLALSV